MLCVVFLFWRNGLSCGLACEPWRVSQMDIRLTIFGITMINLTQVIEQDHSILCDKAQDAGIDWNATLTNLNLTSPNTLKGGKVVPIESKHKGKCWLGYSIKASHGIEFPIVTFINQSGDKKEVYSGFKTAAKLSKGRSLANDTQALEIIEQRKAERAEHDKQRQLEEQQKAAANKARNIKLFKEMPAAKASSYFERKQLPLHYLKSIGIKAFSDKYGEFIAIPFYNLNGELTTYERIYSGANKAKRIALGTTGLNYAVVSGNDSKLYICEGLADAITAHLITGFQAYTSNGIDNARKLAIALAEKYPSKEIILAVDRDHAGLSQINHSDLATYSRVKFTYPINHNDLNDAYIKGDKSLKNRLLNPAYSRAFEHKKYNSFSIETGKANLLKSAQGTGKTSQIKSYLASIDDKKTVLAISHRTSLIEKLSSDFNLFHYQDITQENRISNKELAMRPKLAICVNSLYHMARSSSKYDVVIIDEIEQVLHSIANDETMKNDNIVIYDYLIRLVHNAGTLILSDADIGNKTLALLTGSELEMPAIELVNTFKPKQGQQVKLLSESAFTAAMASCTDSDKVFIGSDSKNKVNELVSRFDNKKAFILTADTSDKPETQEIIANINERVTDFDLMAFSPSGATGVSIDEGHGFTKAFFHFNGRTLAPNDCIQMMNRLRGQGVEIFLYIGSFTTSFPNTYTKALKQLIEEPTKETALFFGYNFQDDIIFTPLAHLWAHSQAEYNQGRSNFRVNLIEAIKNNGFEVEEIKQDSDKGNEILKAERQARREEKHKKVEYNTKLLADALPATATKGAIAHLASKLYSGTLNKELRNYEAQQMAPSKAKQQDLEQLQDLSDKKINAQDLKHAVKRRKLAKDMFKAIAIDTDKATSNQWSTTEHRQIKSYLKANKQDIETYLNYSFDIEALSRPVRTFNNLLSIFGIKAKEVAKDKKSRTYQIDSKTIEAMNLMITHGEIIRDTLANHGLKRE